MIIKTASFKNLHGFLNQSLSFDPGVNILIGVNGSGKTSILNGMAWTLSPASVQSGLPAAYLLSNLKFDEINIAYTTPGKRKYTRVKAKRFESTITITVDSLKDALEIPIVVKRETTPYNEARTVEEAADLVVRIMDDQRNNPVLEHLSGLPGPLYLPLDRKWAEEREPVHRLRRLRTRRSTTAGHLPISAVLALAERAFRQEQYQTSALNEKLRNSFVVSLFQGYETRGLSGMSTRVWTKDELAARRERVVKTLGNLGLGDVRKLTRTFFSGLEEVVERLGGRTTPKNWISDPESDMWLKWIVEASLVASRIERLIPLIQEYDSDRTQITRRSTAFQASVNSFLSENGKTLNFMGGNELAVQLENGNLISSHDLSSGELQLLILFTFLYFQFDDPDQEFPVMVDEPELSLHVAWQNRYGESILAANPKAQFIIATHSPEIASQVAATIIDTSPQMKNHVEV